MILITGGSGFIGSHFHNYVQHDKIINLDLVAPQFNHSAKFIQGDIRKEVDVQKALTGNRVTSIISLAAKHHDFGIGHDEYFDTNEEGTEVICKAASEHRINEIIFYSSVAVYGIRDEISTERLEPRPDSPYGSSKLAGERVLAKWATADATRKILIIRPTVTFGAHNVANMYNLIRQIDSRMYFHLGKAKNIKSIAYVENLVQATLFLKERIKSGVSVYNYADEPQLTAREISEIIAEELDKRILFTMPLGLALLTAIPFDLAIKLSGKNLPISSSRIKKLATQTYHSAGKIFDEGFTPQYSTKEGIRKMVSWYKTIKP